MKKYFLILTMMLTAVSGAWAIDPYACGDGVTWSYNSDSKTLTISKTGEGTGAMADYNTPVNRPWIGYVNDITSVVIGAGVTHIGMGAFASCTNLTTVTFDGTPTLTSIGDLAFINCSKLETITIPAGVTSIGVSAFDHCTGLTSVSIPAGVTTIYGSAFYGCINLASINIPASVTHIYGSAFYGCINLASISFAANTPLTSDDIGSNVFYECPNLQTLKISGTGAMADYYGDQPWISLKDQITTVTIESGVTKIGDYAFEVCTNLTAITIPAGVTAIGIHAFAGCSNLASVTIPASVTSIGVGVFYGCTNLTAFDVDTNNPNYSSDASGVLFNKAKTTIVSYPAGKTATTYEIPTTVTSIGNGAFSGCTNLTSVNIPANVTAIGEHAFDGCTNLASVTVYAPSCSLGSNTFDHCADALTIYVFNEKVDNYKAAANWSSYAGKITGLNGGYCGTTGHETDVMWLLTGNTLTIWGTGAMADYNSSNQPWYSLRNQITTVTIESGVTSIGNGAFLECTNLASVTIPASVTSIGNSAFIMCSKLASVNIPASVTSIGNYAFLKCTSLSSVTFATGSSLAIIGEQAFSECSALESITIPASVETIGEAAFANCTSLASVTFADGSKLTSISYATFTLCSKLASVNIPASVNAIGNYAFGGCTKMESFNVAEGNANYASEDGVLFNKAKTTLIQYPAGKEATTYAIPSTVTSIGEYAFENCTNLTSITIPASVTTIGNGAFSGSNKLTAITIPDGVTVISDNAFYGCTKLTSVIIPTGVTSIGIFAFCYCTSMESITIPANVSSIGDGAFIACSKLASVIVLATTPPALGSSAFNENASDRKIYVPSASVGTYKGTTGWSAYESAIQAIPVVASGNCGTEGHESDVTWEIIGFENNYLLTISGTGEMKGYNPGGQPWDAYNGGITTVVIGNGVTNIGRNICYGYTTLTYVSIPASVTSIGEQAFEDCANLTSITIPAGVTSIGEKAFKGCANLTSITIPAGVTSIGKEAFYGCSSLSSINIPAGIETFDWSWFNGCSSLTAINVANENAYYASEDGVLFNKTKTTLIQYPAGKEATTYTIPSTVTTIGDDAFSGSTKLTSVTIPANVASIGKGAFSMSKNLASVTFAAGSSLTSISDNAFYDCDNLTSITIPVGVTSIGARAFCYCSKLTSVTIPAGVTSIGESAFSTCVKLPSITLPASVTSIGDYAFYQCVELATLTLNSSPLIGEKAFDNLKSGAVVAINAPAHDTDSYQWATFYNENYAFQADDNTQVFKVTLSGSTVTLLEVTDKIVNAGTPVVLKSTGNPVMTLTTASSSDTQGNDLVGTSATMTNPGNAYVLNNGTDGVGFYKLASTGTIEFGKAYLVATAGAREFLGFDETTGISEKIKVKSEKSGEGSDVIYDIHGRRVNGKPSKGLYIINGKKVVMK